MTYKWSNPWHTGLWKVVGDKQLSIPTNSKNRDYIEYLEWVESGGVTEMSDWELANPDQPLPER